MMSRIAAAALPVALLAVLAPSADPQDAVPGARAELVQLDVVVTDGQGALVRDLRREDFQVLEDGKPQAIAQFFVAGRTAVPASVPGAPLSPSPPDAAAAASLSVAADPTAPGRGRHVAIVVDDLHMNLRSVTEAKAALRRFASDVMGADDEVALLTTSGVGSRPAFTRDRAALAQAVEGLTTQERAVGRGPNSQMTPEQAALILRGDRSALQLAATNMIQEPGSVLSPTSPQAAVEGAASEAVRGAISASGESVDKAAEREVERQARAILNEALRYSLATISVVDDVVRGMGRLPGRKLVLLVSDGFLDGSGTREARTLDLRRILDAATRSGTVVYTLDSRGLYTGADAASTSLSTVPGLQSRVDRVTDEMLRDTLVTIADGTGGFLVRGTNDFEGGLRRMMSDNETYYLLAYEPLNTRRDGRFRKIEVRVPRRSGLTIRTRSGYYAPDAKVEESRARAAAKGGAAALAVEEARAALAAPAVEGGLPVALVADYASLPPAGAQVLVRAHVDLARVQWQDVQGRRRASVDLIGGVFDASGQPVGEPFARRSDLDVAAADLEKAKASGLQFQQWVPLSPGRYEVRVVAREKGASPPGGASLTVDVPDLATKKLTLSGLFLSSSAAADAGTTGPARRFKQGDTMYFQFYVYNAARKPDGTADVAFQTQVWSGGKTVAASALQPARMEVKDGVEVPETHMMSLDRVGPGDHELRVLVNDRVAGTSTLRRVPFTVE